MPKQLFNTYLHNSILSVGVYFYEIQTDARFQQFSLLCLLHILYAQQSQADFMEMYNVLTPEMEKTEMANETLQLAPKALSGMKRSLDTI